MSVIEKVDVGAVSTMSEIIICQSEEVPSITILPDHGQQTQEIQILESSTTMTLEEECNDNDKLLTRKYSCAFKGSECSDQDVNATPRRITILNFDPSIKFKNSFVCSMCDKDFVTNNLLREHMKSHLGVEDDSVRIFGKEEYLCASCGKTFTNLKKYECHVGKAGEEGHDSVLPACVKKRGGRKRATDYDEFDSSDADVAQHARVVTGDRPYECVTCGKAFPHKSDIRRHVRVHTGKLPFKCYYCTKAFSCSSNRNTHTRRMHADNPEPPYLNVRGSVVKDQGSPSIILDSPSRNNTDPVYEIEVRHADEYSEGVYLGNGQKIEFTSEVVPDVKSTRVSSQNQKDTGTHNEEVVYSCVACGKTFDNLTRYELHVGKPTEDGEMLVLPVCMKKRGNQRRASDFGEFDESETDVIQHVRMGTGERPYECITCGKAFPHKSDIRRHVRVHTGKLPFQCSYCPKAFSCSSNRNTHMKRMHNGVLPPSDEVYQVIIVEGGKQKGKKTTKVGTTRSFNLMPGKDGTVQNIQNITYKEGHSCVSCGKIFTSLKKYQGHMGQTTKEGETPGVPVCMKKRKRLRKTIAPDFDENDTDLIQHARVGVGEKPYECLSCEKRFPHKSDIRRHIRVHTGQLPYQCSYCPKAFSCSSNRNAHTKKMHGGALRW